MGCYFAYTITRLGLMTSQIAYCKAYSSPANCRPAGILYTVEWSYFENFSRIVGSQVIADVPGGGSISYQVDDLEPGNRYYVRVRAGNASGYGQPTVTSPTSATPSSKQ